MAVSSSTRNVGTQINHQMTFLIYQYYSVLNFDNCSLFLPCSTCYVLNFLLDGVRYKSVIAGEDR